MYIPTQAMAPFPSPTLGHSVDGPRPTAAAASPPSPHRRLEDDRPQLALTHIAPLCIALHSIAFMYAGVLVCMCSEVHISRL